METFTDLENNLNQFRRENNRFQEAETLNLMGHYLLRQGQWSRASKILMKSLEIFEEKKQKTKQAYILACLGLISWEQSQVKKAIESFELSLKIIDNVGDIYSRRMVEAILSLAFWRKGEWGKSLILLKNVLPLDIDSIPQTYLILHRAILKAINLISKRIPVAQANNNHLRIMQGHFTLVPFFIYLGQNKVANIHLLESEVLAKRLNNEKILKTISDLRNLINYIVL